MVGHTSSATCTFIVHAGNPDPIQGQGQGRGASEFPKIALFYVYAVHHFGVEIKADG